MSIVFNVKRYNQSLSHVHFLNIEYNNNIRFYEHISRSDLPCIKINITLIHKDTKDTLEYITCDIVAGDS